MNRFAAAHPEDWEERQEALVDSVGIEASRIRKEEPLRPCKHCGTPCRGSWCSSSCQREEDGPNE